MQPPATGDSWHELSDSPLPVGAVYDWCVRPSCGAVVLFSGTVRDHAVDADGVLREGVTVLDYEAYSEHVVPTFREIEHELRRRWPDTGRVALLHRVGVMGVGESSVVVAVSSPHRPEAFEAGRYAIDAIKATAPIWKREQWEGGSDWGTGAHPPVAPSSVPTAAGGTG